MILSFDFRFKEAGDNKKKIFERPDVVEARHAFLRNIDRLRNQGYRIVYLDESWVNQNHVPRRRWVDADGGAGNLPPAGKGGRIIMLHAGKKWWLTPPIIDLATCSIYPYIIVLRTNKQILSPCFVAKIIIWIELAACEKWIGVLEYLTANCTVGSQFWQDIYLPSAAEAGSLHI